jgi:hypothetical protein
MTLNTGSSLPSFQFGNGSKRTMLYVDQLTVKLNRNSRTDFISPTVNLQNGAQVKASRPIHAASNCCNGHLIHNQTLSQLLFRLPLVCINLALIDDLKLIRLDIFHLAVESNELQPTSYTLNTHPTCFNSGTKRVRTAPPGEQFS